MPTRRDVNASKSDSLPARHLVRERRRAFCDFWGRVYEARPERFRREAEGQVGRSLSTEPRWFDELFDVMAESIESNAAATWTASMGAVGATRRVVLEVFLPGPPVGSLVRASGSGK